MNNIFESKEPIGEWMDKHFKSLKYIMVACPPTERFEAFRNKVREWLHQHDHSKEVEIRALYDELHSLKQQEPKASEGLSEKLERLDALFNTISLESDSGDWVAYGDHSDHRIMTGVGSTPLEAVQALEEQLKEGE